jgi:hypothetical protein
VENARVLDERLRKIVKEISSRTGNEIKHDLLGELEAAFHTVMKEYSRKETTRLMMLLKKAVEKM